MFLSARSLFVFLIVFCASNITAKAQSDDWKLHFLQGNEFIAEGNPKQGLEEFSTALHLIKQNPAQNLEALHQLISEMHTLYLQFGDYAKAIEIGEYLLNAHEVAAAPTTSDSYLQSLRNLSVAYYIIDDHSKVIALNLKSLEIAEKLYTKKHIQYGTGLINLASSYYSLGDYASTANNLNYLEQLEENWTSNPEYGNLCYMMGIIFSQLGNIEKAIVYAEKSLKYTEDKKKLKLYRMHLNQYYKDANRFEDVIAFYKNELDLLKASKDTLNFRYGNLLLNLGDAYKLPEKFEEGLPYYFEALKLTEQISGKPSPDYSYSQLKLAQFYIYFWKEREAIEMLETALKGFKPDENIELYSDILENLGIENYYQGNYDAALDNLKKAAETSDRSEDYNLHRLIALSYRYKSDLQTSAKLLEELVRMIPQTNREELYQAKAFLSDVYQEMGEKENALNLYININSDLLKELETNFSFRNTKEKELFLEGILYRLNKSQSFEYINGKAYPDITEININNILIQKGLLLNNFKNILEELSSLEDEDVKEEVFAYRRNKNEITFHLSAGKNEKVIDSLQSLVNESELKLSRLYHSNFPMRQKVVKNWKLVKEQLEKGEVAIEFSHFQYHDIQNWTDSIYYTAYIISAEEEFPLYVKLFEVKQLQEILKNSSPETLYTTRGSQASKAANSVKSNQEIYNLVWANLEPYLKDIKTIYFAPDGILHQIPFAALQGEGDKDVLCQKYNLIQLGSTNLIADGEKDFFPGKTLLWGGIDYDKSAIQNKESEITAPEKNSDFLTSLSNSRSSGESWPYLPGTQSEIESLHKLLNAAGVKVDIFSGTAATEEEFKALDGKSPKVLHIASHGFFFKNTENSIDAEKEAKVKSQRFKMAKDPLLRSGLVLAGGNYVWETGKFIQGREDGILTAMEVANLDLSATGLVVLSACETGLGDIEGSEGVYGLQRAFKLAGAQALMMSLWQVPDTETAEFMEVFYRQWTKGISARQAFLKTQRKMQRKYSDSPQNWAAFVMVE